MTTRPPQPTVLWHVLTVLWVLPAPLRFAHICPAFALGALVLLGGPLGLIWCVQFARMLLIREARCRLTPRALGSWAVFPLTGFVIWVLCFSMWGLALRVKLSEPALMRLVEEAGTGRTSFDRPVRAGLFVIRDAHIEDACVLLEVDESWVHLSDGIAYVREGGPPRLSFSRHLTGPWWEFYFLD